MLNTADGLNGLLKSEAWEIEEPKHGLVAYVKEKVSGAVIVTILGNFNQREAQEPVIEFDGLFNIRADQHGV